MPIVEVSLRGFAFIGLTLCLMALTILVYLYRRQKTLSIWLLMGFFGAITLSGIATILTNAFVFWGTMFDPWQDAFVLLGGVSLALFAYQFPRNDQPREGRWVAGLMIGLFVIALGYTAVFNYQYLFAYTPELSAADAYYTLMPLGTLIVVIAFARRAVHFSRLAQAGEDAGSQRSTAWLVLRPTGKEAKALAGFALALSLGLLPGLSVLLPVPAPLDFLMLNIGSLLALATIALVYFNYAPEMTSFMAKLVGITLLTLLVILSIIGTVTYRNAVHEYANGTVNNLSAAYASVLAGRPQMQPQQIAYVAAWPADAQAGTAAYQLLYARDNLAGFDFDAWVRETRGSQYVTSASGQQNTLRERTGVPWQVVRRYRTFPAGSNQPDFIGWRVTDAGTTYEIGLRERDFGDFLSALSLNWMVIIGATSLIVLALFPFFFRRTLVKPLSNLMQGIVKVKQGDLSTTVPIQYNDEIGSLTGSFNTLTGSLEQSYDTLEQRIADRTRELSAFSDLTMLSAEQDNLENILEPALSRVMETTGCHAIALHLLNPEDGTLELFAERGIDSAALAGLQKIALPPAIAERFSQAETPIITSIPAVHNDCPEAFLLPGQWTYAGCPVTAGGEALGWLSCYHQNTVAINTSETSFLLAVARQMGIMVENHRLRQRIGQMAIVEERQRLARDLHDSVTQLLYSTTLFARAGKDALADNDAARLKSNLNQVQATSMQAFREMRSLLYELQPPALEGSELAGVLADRFDSVERRLGICVNYQADASFTVRGALERELYYVITEALNNSLRHAEASQLDVNLARNNGHLAIRIADNGRGFVQQPDAQGMGLKNMHQRITALGGTLDLQTGLNQGTTLQIEVPFQQINKPDRIEGEARGHAS
jgi:two-component system nitrate/nitrite sensor histidine kinase NarX